MSATVDVSPSSLQSLELPGVLALVAELATTDVGRERLSALRPVVGEPLQKRRREYLEMESLLADGAVVRGVDEQIGLLTKELFATRPELDGRRLRRWGRILEAAGEATGRIGAESPGLAARLADRDDLGWLAERIEVTLDERGEVRDDASPVLARARRRIGKARSKAYASLSDVLGERPDSFSEDTTPLHNGRLVLLLRSGERGRVEGLVHGASGSGRSLYFEPLAAVESNNELQEAVAEEEAERRRLLRELGEALLASRESIEALVGILARLDALQAAARFAERVDGRLLELSDGDLSLVEARHPLLMPQTRELRRSALGQPGHAGEVTPLDVELSGKECVLVVTGPNAGGKTVALKTVGLTVLLTLCGLPAPAGAGSRVPESTGVVAVVGDEQDLMQDRSTFSGRLLRLREAWEAAGPSALVLLDELGSGTDPEEGAALAIGLLERLVAERTLSIVTTHLVALAAAATESEGAVCACMEFDRRTRRPTFRLLLGPPGGSEAIALARQLGLPEPWLERAEALVGAEHGRLQHLLAEVEELRGELEAESEGLRRLREEAAVERQSLAAERERLQREVRKVGKRLERDLEGFRRRVRERMDEEVERLREELAAGRRRGVAARAVERLFEDRPQPLPSVDEDEERERGQLEVGATVRHADYSWTGTLEKLSGERATVVVSGKRLQCDAGRLRRTAAGEASSSPRPRISVDEPDVPRELHLIGQRVDEAIERLDRYLDQALLVPHSEVRVIHGHGSGRLRNAVRDFLEGHPAVARSRPGGDREGGDGATVVRLRS